MKQTLINAAFVLLLLGFNIYEIIFLYKEHRENPKKYNIRRISLQIVFLVILLGLTALILASLSQSE